MDYFAYSPFWDPKSNNNGLRVQRRIEQPTYGHAEEKLYVSHISYYQCCLVVLSSKARKSRRAKVRKEG